MKSTRWIVASMLAVVVGALLLTSCVRLTPEASAELQSLRQDVAALEAEGQAVGEQMARVAVQVKEAHESGDYVKLASLVTEYQELQTRAERIAQRTVGAHESVKRLIREHDVPWWHVALWLVGSLAAGATGTAGIAAVKGQGLRAALTAAQEGVRLLVGAVEQQGSTQAVKTDMAKIKHPAVEAAVLDLNKRKTAA